MLIRYCLWLYMMCSNTCTLIIVYQSMFSSSMCQLSLNCVSVYQIYVLILGLVKHRHVKLVLIRSRTLFLLILTVIFMYSFFFRRQTESIFEASETWLVFQVWLIKLCDGFVIKCVWRIFKYLFWYCWLNGRSILNSVCQLVFVS